MSGEWCPQRRSERMPHDKQWARHGNRRCCGPQDTPLPRPAATLASGKSSMAVAAPSAVSMPRMSMPRRAPVTRAWPVRALASTTPPSTVATSLSTVRCRSRREEAGSCSWMLGSSPGWVCRRLAARGGSLDLAGGQGDPRGPVPPTLAGRMRLHARLLCSLIHALCLWVHVGSRFGTPIEGIGGTRACRRGGQPPKPHPMEGRDPGSRADPVPHVEMKDLELSYTTLCAASIVAGEGQDSHPG